MKTSCYIGVTIVTPVCCDHAGVLPSEGKCYDRGIVTINSFLPRLGTFTTTIIVYLLQSENKQQCHSFSPGVPDPDHEYGRKA